MREVSHRSAFLLDEDGVVRGAWEYANDELPDIDVLIGAAQAL